MSYLISHEMEFAYQIIKNGQCLKEEKTLYKTLQLGKTKAS